MQPRSPSERQHPSRLRPSGASRSPRAKHAELPPRVAYKQTAAGDSADKQIIRRADTCISAESEGRGEPEAGLLVEVVGYYAQDGGDLVTGRLVGVAVAAQAVGDPVEQLDEVLDNDDHLVGLLALRLGLGGDQRRRRIEHANRQCPLAALAFGHTELDPAARLQR